MRDQEDKEEMQATDVEKAKGEITFGDVLSALFLLSFIFGLAFYGLCVNHINVNEMGGWYDAGNGAIWTNDKPGWYVTKPYPWVHEITVDLRPRKIEITSNARLVNAKMVRFKREGFDEYIKRQGFTAPADDVLLGYAYSGRNFDFIEILEEPDKMELLPVRK